MMVLLYNCFLILIVGVFVYKYVLKYYKTCETNQARHFILLASLIHFIGTAFFYITMKEPLGEIDAYKYYIGAKQATVWIDLFGINKSIISFLIYPFVQIGIQLSVLFFVFSCISLIGLISYFKLINFQEFKLLNKFMLVFFLMPSIHFWGGFVG